MLHLDCWLQCETVCECVCPQATECEQASTRLTVCFDDGVRVAAQGVSE